MSPAELRAWIASRLDPIETYDPTARTGHSDFDEQGGVPDGVVLTQAAVLIPLVEHEAGLTVLLTRRADTLRAHTGQVAFPGGRCDPGETPWETALREAHEEVGLEPGWVTLAGLSTRYQTLSGFDITPVVGFVRPGFALKPNPAEVADVFETPFAFLMDEKNHERRSRQLPDGMTRHYYAMPYHDRLIWGVTAGMLRILYERLYGPVDGREP
ncbi:MAG: CoA pyrophosphatase [Caulobacteraceae bacterium]|nr:CoA pyrophosphatase [Caulobacteraceae bacterium]